MLCVSCYPADACCLVNGLGVAVGLMDCNHPPSCYITTSLAFFSFSFKLLVIILTFLLETPNFLGSSQDVNASSVTSNPCYIQVISAYPTYLRQYLQNEGDIFLQKFLLAFHSGRSTSFSVLVNATSFTIFHICGSVFYFSFR